MARFYTNSLKFQAVRRHPPFRLTSSNAIDPVESLAAFLLSVVAGARRFTAKHDL
jgi:hypothetical protein